MLGLGAAWLVLLWAIFRAPDSPHPDRLLYFLFFVGVSGGLAYLVLINVFDYNPNPTRVSLARSLTQDKMIYLGDIVPGLYDLNYIRRVDADGDPRDETQEWVAFYQYDVDTDLETGSREGPFGAAIYDHDDCRPPAILSYELVPVNYEYLGEDRVNVQVANIIEYEDPHSVLDAVALDRPEVIIVGYTRGVATDLNVFRKVGTRMDCSQRRQWQLVNPGAALPNTLRYENVGSFRGTYGIERDGSIITVVDRAGFERSQLTIRKQYRPEDASYFLPGTQILLEPVEYTLAFGPGEPDQITQVYYPEKAVLAFYLALGKDKKKLEQAESYLSDSAQATYKIQSDPFGLSTASDSVARARDDLARVLVWEIRYTPDVEAEQLHETRLVTVKVVGVNEDGDIDYAHPCLVTWTVVGVPNGKALPYGCEWRLHRYQSICP